MITPVRKTIPMVRKARTARTKDNSPGTKLSYADIENGYLHTNAWYAGTKKDYPGTRHSRQAITTGDSGIPGEKSFNLKQISPRILVEMTVAGFVITPILIPSMSLQTT
jgi:hypothetical protein